MFDVIVIVGGVIGGAILRKLTKYRLSVCLLEKENNICMGQSKANSGIVHAGFDATAHYVLNGAKLRNSVEVVNGSNISYVVPQKIDKNASGTVKLFFRVTNPFRDCTITTKCGDKIL